MPFFFFPVVVLGGFFILFLMQCLFIEAGHINLFIYQPLIYHQGNS